MCKSGEDCVKKEGRGRPSLQKEAMRTRVDEVLK